MQRGLGEREREKLALHVPHEGGGEKKKVKLGKSSINQSKHGIIPAILDS